MSGERVRLSINLGPRDADPLEDYARRKGVSKTEAVNRAIAILSYFDAVLERGAAINVVEGDTVTEVVFLSV